MRPKTSSLTNFRFMEGSVKSLSAIFKTLIKIEQAAKVEFRALIDVMRNGFPDVLLEFCGGIGDELLLTAVAHEMKLRNPGLRIWQVSQASELLFKNPDYTRIFNLRHWPLRHARILKNRKCRLTYALDPIPGEWEIPPDEHIIAALCRKAGIRGEVSIRPYYFVREEERLGGRLAGKQIVIQCVGKDSYWTVMENKLWDKKNFQTVINELRQGMLGNNIPHIIQVGNDKDPLLDGVTDLRGKTTLRETAAILGNSQCFVGTSGFLAHLARAVGCRSVIIYGGREHSTQTGYICNENLNSFIECAPCWRWKHCNNGRKCMEMITPEDVLEGIKRISEKKDIPLETEMVFIK